MMRQTSSRSPRNPRRTTLSFEPLEGRALMATAHVAARPLAAAAVVAPSAQAAAYRAAVLQVMAQYHVPGAVAGVWVPGRPGWTIAQGYSDVASQQPISLSEHFPIRSVTKSFTVTALLRLARDHKLSLDDPIGKYVSGIPNGREITLAQLAGMTSGLKNYTESDLFLQQFVADLERSWTPQQIVDTATPLSPVFAPGSQYEYNNTNTILLGMVVHRVSGQSLSRVFHQMFFTPLGLTGTRYPQSTHLVRPHPTPYVVDPATGALEEVPPINLSSLGAAGGMVSTLADLKRWGRALGSGVLVGPYYQHLRESLARPATNGPEYDVYGLGIGRLNGWWGHTGEALGFQAATFYQPGTGAVIAVALNSSQPTNVAAEIFKALSAIAH